MGIRWTELLIISVVALLIFGPKRLPEMGSFPALHGDGAADLPGRSQSFPMRFAIVDWTARRIAGDVTLKRSEFGVGTTKGFFNPLRVDDEVHVMIEAVVPVSQDSRASVPSQHSRD